MAPAPADLPAGSPGERTARAATHALGILAPPAGPIALAVSGGSDSTALLFLAHDWARAAGRRLVVATVDHDLRPEAAAEAEAVGRLCSRLDLPHTTLRWRPGALRVSQADARMARHRLLATWAREAGAAALALGHTADDRIETFLIRARAGSFWRGLAGPAPRSPSPAWPEGAGLSLIRPLLGCFREALRAHLRARDEDWIDDPSNDALRYERVRMRQLAARLPDTTRASLLQSMDRLAALRAAALAGAADAFAALVRPLDMACALDAASLRALPDQVRRLLLEALVLAAGGAAGPVAADALVRLDDVMMQPGALRGGVTLGGAKIEARGMDIVFRQAAPRRSNPVSAPGFSAGVGPALARAASLLGDPALAALKA